MLRSHPHDIASEATAGLFVAASGKNLPSLPNSDICPQIRPAKRSDMCSGGRAVNAHIADGPRLVPC